MCVLFPIGSSASCNRACEAWWLILPCIRSLFDRGYSCSCHLFFGESILCTNSTATVLKNEFRLRNSIGVSTFDVLPEVVFYRHEAGPMMKAGNVVV